LDTILKHAFDILETSDDNREKLQAMELFKDTHLVKQELKLLSNATTIDSALSYIKSKQQQKKHLSLDSTSNDNSTNDNDQLTATSGRQTVF